MRIFVVLQGNMRMFVDAEQTYLQPAIDAVAIALQQKFNKDEAVVLNTYQCYLKVLFHQKDSSNVSWPLSKLSCYVGSANPGPYTAARLVVIDLII